jgi:ankyrin repeat protein
MHGAMSGNVDIVKAILDKGADINARDERGSSALTWAAVMDHSEVVKLLKSLGAKSDLWIASLTGDKDEAKQFLDKGADVNAVDGLGFTPLMNAAKKGRTAVVKLLLAKGADPTAKRPIRNRTAIDDALRGGSVEMVVMLLERGTGSLPTSSKQRAADLIHACRRGRIDVVKYLLANGTSANGGDPKGSTPLIAACENGYIEIAKLLVAKGADVNKRGAKGDTALIRSVSRGHLEAVEFLLSNGADVNARGKHGYTALNMKCYGPIHDLLRARGAKTYKGHVVGSPPKF